MAQLIHSTLLCTCMIWRYYDRCFIMFAKIRWINVNQLMLGYCFFNARRYGFVAIVACWLPFAVLYLSFAPISYIQQNKIHTYILLWLVLSLSFFVIALFKHRIRQSSYHQYTQRRLDQQLKITIEGNLDCIILHWKTTKNMKRKFDDTERRNWVTVSWMETCEYWNNSLRFNRAPKTSIFAVFTLIVRQRHHVDTYL